jgi:hypothetical protein
MQWFAIVSVSILSCITYGIIHDQITARICVEYFTIGHPPVVLTDDPTTLGLVWGIIATWWVGVQLGVPLAIIARAGSRPKQTIRFIAFRIVVLMACIGLFSAVSGIVGYFAASQGWVYLTGFLAEAVPAEKQIPFLTDMWIHSASYLGATVGGISLMIRVWKSRSQKLHGIVE